MPVTNISLLRAGGQAGTAVPPPSNTPGSIPDYAVLFYYTLIGKWDATNFGILNTDMFRDYSSTYYPNAQFYDPVTGNPVALKSNPLIRCIDVTTGWKTSLGKCWAPVFTGASSPYPWATYFESGGAHSPSDKTKFSPSNAPNGYGFVTGDTASATSLYYPLSGTHSGHFHSCNTVLNNIGNIIWGELNPGTTVATSATDYAGSRTAGVHLVIKDPSLKQNKPLTYLPKNCIVFGSSLPSSDYTKIDSQHHQTSATGLSIPLMSKNVDVGVVGDTTLNFTAVSNTSGRHTHAAFPVATTKATSDKTGQTAYIYNSPAGSTPAAGTPGIGFGDHQHTINYSATLGLKSVELNAYITNSVQTPLVSNVIIAYSIGLNTGYNGPADGPSALPPNWYFCDGNNGTPDLRGYFINANFRDTVNGTQLNATSTLNVAAITVAAAGDHGHAGPPNLARNFVGTDQVTTGTGTPTYIGAHEYNIVTQHSHTVSVQTQFSLAGQIYRNFKVGVSVNYTPPAVDLAFIMYKAP